MLNRLLLLLTIALAAVAQSAPATYAQTPTDTIELLAIDMWPDYDRASMLVLLTGTLPTDTVFPAEVTIPLAPGAEINAVARIDASNSMVDDIQYSVDGESVTFVTPDPTFRVEYYAPYDTAGSSRSFRFDWLSDLTVAQATTAVQEPAAATDIAIVPPPVNVSADRGDGLNYHTLAAQPIPVGERFLVEVSYDMASPQLSAELLFADAGSGVESTDAGSGTAVVPTPVDEGINWPLVLAVAGGLLVVVAIVWQVATSRPQNKRVAKPRPQRSQPTKAKPHRAKSSTSTGTSAKFCHNCGQPTSAGDRFCRNCGEKLK